MQALHDQELQATKDTMGLQLQQQLTIAKIQKPKLKQKMQKCSNNSI
jgi:hypothetical protein